MIGPDGTAGAVEGGGGGGEEGRVAELHRAAVVVEVEMKAQAWWR